MRNGSKLQPGISFIAGMVVLCGMMVLFPYLKIDEHPLVITAERSNSVTYAGQSFNIEDGVSRASLTDLLEQHTKSLENKNDIRIKLETDPSTASSVIQNTFIAVTNLGVMSLDVVDGESKRTAHLHSVGTSILKPFNAVPLGVALKDVWVNPETKNSFVSLKLDTDGVTSRLGKFPYPIPGKVLDDIRHDYITIYVTEATKSGELIDCVATLQDLSAPAILVTWAPMDDP